MNSLDSLELIKSEIYEAERNLLKFTNLLKEKPKREGYSFWITYFTNRLNILQQIKLKLEAWEVVKDKINITDYYDNEQDYEEDINSHNALCLNSNIKIQNSNNEEEWFIPLDNEDCKKLKKALEVKDEDRK